LNSSAASKCDCLSTLRNTHDSVKYPWMNSGLVLMETDIAAGVKMLKDMCQTQRDLFHTDDRDYCYKGLGTRGGCDDDTCEDCKINERDLEVFDFSMWICGES